MLAVLAGLAAGCGGSLAAVRDELPAAPLDPALAGVPGARASWMPDAEFGGGVYVVTVDPPGARPAGTLVLVHGLGTVGMRDFYPVLGPLSRGRRVVMFDLPGFARSGRGNERYTPARYAAVLAQVIDRYAGGRADVLGHSMGGAISLMHAATYPRQVRRLVLVDAAGILQREAWFGHHLRRVTGPAGMMLPGAVDQANQVLDFVFNLTRSLDLVPDLILLTPALRERMLAGDPARISALGLMLTDFSEAISAVTTPTLIVWGDADVVAPPRTGELLVDRLPDATMSVLAGVGHNVMAEAPARLVDVVEPYLAAPMLPPRAFAPTGTVVSSQGDLSCNGQNDLVVTGTYDDVVLDRCDHARFDHATVRHLVLRGSRADLVRSTVTQGITLEGSHLLATGGRIAGEVGLDVKNSTADLAGVTLEVNQSVFRLSGASKAVFSVCPVAIGPRSMSGRTTGFLHKAVASRDEVVEGGL